MRIMFKIRKIVTNSIFIFLIIVIMCTFTACGEKAEVVSEQTNKTTKKPETTETVKDDNSTLGVIYNAYCSCEDYKWLNKINFSPCNAINKKLKDEDIDIKRLWDFQFEKCNIFGNNQTDIIMQVMAEQTNSSTFKLLMIFIYDENEYYDVFSLALTSGCVDYEFIDIDGDGKSEILFDYLTLANATYRYLEIYQCDDKGNLICIYEKNVNTALYTISYGFEEKRPLDFWVIVNKTYYNTDYERKTAKTIKYIYQYNNKYVLKEKELLYKSNKEDFYSWDLL